MTWKTEIFFSRSGSSIALLTKLDKELTYLALGIWKKKETGGMIFFLSYIPGWAIVYSA